MSHAEQSIACQIKRADICYAGVGVWPGKCDRTQSEGWRGEEVLDLRSGATQHAPPSLSDHGRDRTHNLESHHHPKVHSP
jgi:hypothetical protein